MESLPVEVLENIFSYLTVSDQKLISLTCRKFYLVLSRPRFLILRRYILREGIEKTCFLFSNDSVQFNTISFMNDITNGSHHNVTSTERAGSPENYTNQLSISLPQTQLTVRHNLCTWCEFVADLSFENCSPNSQDLSSLLRLCTNLRMLNLSACNSLFDIQRNELGQENCFLSEKNDRIMLRKTPGQTLNRISLAHITSLRDKYLKHVIRTFPYVRDIDLSGCFIGSSAPLYKSNPSDFAHQTQLSFQNLLSELRGLSCDYFSGDALKIILRLNFTGIDDRDLDALCRCSFLCLQGLFVDNCRNITDRGLSSLFSSQHVVGQLKQLSIGIPSPDVSFSSIASSMKIIGPNLKHIRLSKLPISSKSDLASMFSSCSNVEHLDISSCCFKFNGISEYLWMNLHSISSLDLSGHFSLTDEDVSVMSLHLRNRLKYLNVSSCMKLTDLSLEAICVNFSSSLEVLTASWCKGFSDVGVLGNALKPFFMTGIYSVKRLKCLNFSDCHQITKHSFTFQSESYIPQFQNLTSLCLGRIGTLDKDALINISYFAPSLQSLDISRSVVDDSTLIVVINKLKHTLRELFISGCENLTNTFLSHLASTIPYLRVLDISFCPYISEEALLIFQAAMPYLSESKALYVGTAINKIHFTGS